MRRKARAHYDLPGHSSQRSTLGKTDNPRLIATNATIPSGMVYDLNAGNRRFPYGIKLEIAYGVKEARNT